MKPLTNSLLGAAAFVAPLVAGQVKNCPATNVCYSIAVPNSSGSSAYIQLSAPTSYTWVGMGTGTGMTGSSMFIMYTDGSGNVTVSPRKGSGHVMPTFNSAVQVQLLAGSGVSGNTMTANFLCGNCASYFSLSGTDNFIAAWKSGDSLNSASTSATITQHDDTSAWSFDLSQASISSNSNPYVSTSSSSSGNTGSNSGSSSGSGSGGSSGSGSSSSGGTGVVAGSSSSGSSSSTTLVAHGIVASIAFVVLYPLGSLLMPLLGKWYVHAALQMVSFLAMWIAFGLGAKVAMDLDLIFKQCHTLLGTVVVCALVLQPALGYMHHRHYVQHKSRGIISYAHLWYGRVLIALGIVNGGLGLNLANADQAYKIAYAAVAGFMVVVYAIAKLAASRRKSREGRREEKTRGFNTGDAHPNNNHGSPQHSRREVYQGYDTA